MLRNALHVGNANLFALGTILKLMKWLMKPAATALNVALHGDMPYKGDNP